MARLSERLPENVEGEFFVDAGCIDCDICRQLAPGVFAEGAEASYVGRQPMGAGERRRAQMALVACPTAAIGTLHKQDLAEAIDAFPEEIVEGVYFCGFASESSYGAASYLIRRSAGNVLVDSPRAARPLLDRIEAMGGVDLLLLSHRDDVADHAKLQRRFGCRRVLHEADATRDTAAVELRLAGRDPTRLDDDLLAIPVPGHTRGSTAYLYRDEILFSGDHLWSDGEGGLEASRSVCWYSWPEQIRSMERLLDHRFEWVLPGHGRRHHAPAAAMRAELERLVRRMVGRAR